MAEAITFFIESAHLMKELVPLMYLSVDSTIIIIIIGDLASEKQRGPTTRHTPAGHTPA
jgi:hypothetical protein